MKPLFTRRLRSTVRSVHQRSWANSCGKRESAKNLTLLYQGHGAAPMLAPFYDVVAIEFFNVIRASAWSRKLAFRIGSHDTPEEVALEDWKIFANDLGIPARPTLARLESMASSLPDIARDARAEFAGRYGDREVYDRFENYIERRCGWVLGQLVS